MNNQQVFKYAAVFAAGVFAVLGVIGFTSLIQPSAVAPVAANQQLDDSELLAPANPNEALAPSADTAPAASAPEAVSPSAEQPQQQTRNSSAASQSAAAQSLGAGTVIEGVTRVGDLVRNTMVTIEGTVTRINDEDEFIITDSTGSVQVYTGRSYFTVEQGQQVTVLGLVDDGVLLEIYADEIVLPDGSVVEIRHWG
jgi:uncharacterized protein YdeI (BOF family)